MRRTRARPPGPADGSRQKQPSTDERRAMPCRPACVLACVRSGRPSEAALAAHGEAMDLWSLAVTCFQLLCGRLPFGDGVDPADPYAHEIIVAQVRACAGAGGMLAQWRCQTDRQTKHAPPN
jgi:serine/threonine protein kinase